MRIHEIISPLVESHVCVAEDSKNLPPVLYHATYKPVLKNIKLNGLGAGGKRNWSDSKRGVVYLAIDPNVAESYAESSDIVPDEWLDKIVILKISTAGLDPNKFHIDSNVQDNVGDTVEYHGVIPFDNISIYSHGIAEGVPQPGPSSGAPKQISSGDKVETRSMTVGDILSSIHDVPYYNHVIDDYDAGDYSWGVTKKVVEYATYLKEHPQNLSQLPPIIVVDGKFQDGAHRVSALWLLQQRMDPTNPLWKKAKLNVQFVQEHGKE